jgi:hypothetical protein
MLAERKLKAHVSVEPFLHLFAGVVNARSKEVTILQLFTFSDITMEQVACNC